MTWRLARFPKVLMVTLPLLFLVFIISCGGASQGTTPPQAAEKGEAATAEPQAQEVPTKEFVIAPSFGEKPTSQAAAASSSDPNPTVATGPTPTPEVVIATGGIVPMQAYSNPVSKALHEFGSPLDRAVGPMFSTIMEYNPETDDPSDIRGDLAESWDVAEDGVTYTFRLVPTATWWDGQPVTADDVLFSLTSMVCPDCLEITKGQTRSSTILFRDDLDLDASRVVDQNTIELKTKFNQPEFLLMLAVDVTNIIPKHVVEGEGKLQTFERPDDFMGSGPFMWVKFVKDVMYEHTKNENYWKEGLPRIDGMKHFVMTDPATIMAAYATEQVLVQNGPSNNLSVRQTLRLEEENPDKINVRFIGPGGFFGIMLNTTVKPFDDVRVRRAVYLAIHRQPILETISAGKGWLGVPLPPGQWYSMSREEAAQAPGFRELNGEKHPEDLAEARRLMKEAGLENGFDTVITARIAIQYPEVAELVSEQLERFINIRSSVRTLEAAAGFEAYNQGDFAMASQASSLPILTPTGAFGSRYPEGGIISRWLGGGTNDFVVEGIQELYVAQARELDPEKRKAIVQRAEQILLNEDNAYPGLWWRFTAWISNKRIQNLHPNPSSQLQFSWEHIWCDPAC